MNKKIYISPETVRIHLEVSSLILSGSQGPYADAKQHGSQVEQEFDNNEDDNPWERVAHPQDLWE